MFSPKENTYKEMFLINKVKKDLMETTFQNTRKDKTKTTHKITTTNNTSPEIKKDALGTSIQKKTQLVKGSEDNVSNENDIEPCMPEVFNSSIPVTLSFNGNTP